MNELSEYLNTALGAAALAAATYAANWVRKVVGKYFAYLEAKVRRWSTKGAIPAITPEMQNAIEAAASRMLLKMIQERKERARTQAR